MIEARILGLGLIAPGLPDWPTARAVLRGEAVWTEAPVVLNPPEIVSPRERRRLSPVVRLALNVAEEARAASGLSAQSLSVTFASSIGDGGILTSILNTLTTDEKLVSPTQFHNSVHNAAAGYWGIGHGCHRPTSSVAAADFTAAAALTKGLMQCADGEGPVVTAVFDCPLPPPLDAVRPISCPFGVAVVLGTNASSERGPRLRLLGIDDNAEGSEATGPLETLYGAAPTGRLLPLLTALACEHSTIVSLPVAIDQSLRLEVVW